MIRTAAHRLCITLAMVTSASVVVAAPRRPPPPPTAAPAPDEEQRTDSRTATPASNAASPDAAAPASTEPPQQRDPSASTRELTAETPAEPVAQAAPVAPSAPRRRLLGALAPEPWRPTEGAPDLAMRLSMRAPGNWPRWMLLGLESVIPIGLSLVGAVAGVGLGAGMAWLVFARARDTTQVPVSAVLGGGALGALFLGSVVMAGADAILNAGHVNRLWLARAAGFLVIAPLPLLLGGYSLWRAVGYYRFGPYTQLTLSLAVPIAFVVGLLAAPLAGLAAFAVVRGADEFMRGSVISPADPEPAAPANGTPITTTP